MKPKPHSKRVTNAPLGYAVSVVLVWIMALYGMEPPVEVSMAITTICSYLIGWAVKEGPPELL